MAEEVGEGTGLGDDVAESIVGVLRYNIAVGVKVARDVAVVVVAWDEWNAVDGEV